MSEQEDHPGRAPRFLRSLTGQMENLKAWLFLMAMFFCSRLLWLYVTRLELSSEIGWREWARFFAAGFRIDCVAATYLMLPCIVAAALLSLFPTKTSWVRRLRTIWLTLLIVVTPIVTFMNLGYYLSFGTVFDAFLFEFFNGNAQDVLTIAYHDHGLVNKLTISVILSLVGVLSFRRWFHAPVRLPVRCHRLFARLPAQAATTVAVVLIVALGLRGTYRSRPTQRTDASISQHRVLTLGALNPLYNLKTAYKLRSQYTDYFGEDRLVSLPELQPKLATVARTVGGDPVSIDQATALEFDSKVWQRTAAGPPGVTPDHVFVLFLESYDSWPFLDEYRDLHLVEGGRQLGHEGQLLMNHLPGANSSVKSALVTLQGVFDTYHAQQQCLPTSLVCNFERLGYQTRSINGFVSQWGDAEKSALDQGFDEVYCTEHIKPGGETSNLQLHDRTLFEFAADQLSYDQPTFNFIRSSSYHGPWEVDLKAEDCTVGPIPEAIRSPAMRDETLLRTAYGHLKYTDKVMTEFVRTMSTRFPNSLFVITGDHYGRQYHTSAPPTYQGSSVPLILYGPQVLADAKLPENATGSHVDLAATLIELVAPAGFSYASLGKNLLAEQEQPCGVGEQFVIFPEMVVSLRPPARCQRLPWLGSEPVAKEVAERRIARARKIHEAYHGVSYMLSRRSLESAEMRSPENKDDLAKANRNQEITSRTYR